MKAQGQAQRASAQPMLALTAQLRESVGWLGTALVMGAQLPALLQCHSEHSQPMISPPPGTGLFASRALSLRLDYFEIAEPEVFGLWGPCAFGLASIGVTFTIR